MRAKGWAGIPMETFAWLGRHVLGWLEVLGRGTVFLGRVLAGLNRRIDRGMKAHAVFDPASLGAALEALGHG